MSVSKPEVVSRPSPNRNGYSSPRHVEALVLHIAQGSGPASVDWLCSPAAQVSANYLVDIDGTIYEIVPPDEDAWGNGIPLNPDLGNPLVAKWIREGINPNTRTISIEHAGYSSNNYGGSLTLEQVSASEQLQAWLCAQYGIAPDQDHILGHYQIDDVNRHYCPGFSAKEWEAWVGRVAMLVTGQTVPIPPAPEPSNPSAWHCETTDKWVLEPFLSMWKAGGGLKVFGLPITGMYKDMVGEAQGLVVQYFERARFEQQADGSVTFGRLGAELLAVRGS